MGKGYFVFDGFDGWIGNLFVKEIGCFARKTAFFEIGELFDNAFVLRELLFKKVGIENKPFVNIGGDKVFYFEVLAVIRSRK